MDSQAPCPFVESICRSNSTNLILDTGFINTDTHLGINAPPEERLLMRHVLKCAPLLTEGYSSRHGNYTRYNYGAQWRRTESDVPIANYTYEVESLNTQYAISDDGKMIGRTYKLGCVIYLHVPPEDTNLRYRSIAYYENLPLDHRILKY